MNTERKANVPRTVHTDEYPLIGDYYTAILYVKDFIDPQESLPDATREQLVRNHAILFSSSRRVSDEIQRDQINKSLYSMAEPKTIDDSADVIKRTHLVITQRNRIK